MGKLKVFVTGILFLASCVALLGTQGAIAAIQNSYTSTFPSSFGSHLPAFTARTLSLMPNIPTICFTAVVVSILLAGLVLWRARSREAKIYWVTVLGSVNFYVCVFLSGVVLVGFFLLPRVAHGI
jgi:hypothetical protein